MSRLGDVGRVEAVVVRHILEVVVLQREQEVDQGLPGNLELLDQISFLQIEDESHLA